MGQRQLQSGDGSCVERVARRIEAEEFVDVARAAYERAGELAAREYGHRAAVLGALRLASRRSRRPTLAADEVAAPFDVAPETVAAAEETIASRLAPPADEEVIRSCRRRLIVARELLTAVEHDRLHALQLPDSYLADEAPWLLGRALGSVADAGEGTDADDCDPADGVAESDGGDSADDSRDDERVGDAIDAEQLRDHVERLEADLELARLGSTLYRALHEDADRDGACEHD
ncbi:hypothetical protein [Halopiger goleimassiliensis]|uniref:hypothetical protein n=1 Tax=Halopiger goleimassiliensis TaxID=1293048 RepID=UPI000677592E|nr:hypothetical protein [Halopiger goleimassiliensis]